MDFIPNLFVGASIQNPSQLKKLLSQGNSIFNLFLICVCYENNNLMEVVHSIRIHKPGFQKRGYTVIGLAEGKQEAHVLVQEIIQSFIYSTDYAQNGFTNFKKRICSP